MNATNFTFRPKILAAMLPLATMLASVSTRADMLVTSAPQRSVLRYDEVTGAYLGTFVSPQSGGLQAPSGLTFGRDGNFYVADALGNAILRYHGRSGAFLGVFSTNGLSYPEAILFGPDGNLYVLNGVGSNVVVLDGVTGALNRQFGGGVLEGPYGLRFGQDGSLFVADWRAGVLRFDVSNGDFLGVFCARENFGAPPIGGALDLCFGPDRNLYVSDGANNRVLRFNGSTGSPAGVFASGGGLWVPQGITFGPDGHLYVVSNNFGNGGRTGVIRYNGLTGAFIDQFATGGISPGECCIGFLVFTPFVRLVSPLGNGGYLNQTIQSIIVDFRGLPVSTGLFNSTNIVVDGAQGRQTATSIAWLSNNYYQVTFPLLSADGAYQFTLLPTLLGTNGSPLDLNLNGTSGETNDLVSFTLFVDSTGPRVTQHKPSGGVPLGLGAMEIEFNEAIDPATFNPADAVIVTPAGQTNAITAVQTINSNRFRITFPPLSAPGPHRLRVGPNVQDLAGNSLDQDRDGLAGEAADDVYDVCFFVHAASGLGLVSWWRAESNALDSVGTNHGTLQNGAGFAPGRIGQAFTFDGNNDLFRAANSPSLQPETVTAEAWVKGTSPGTFQYILSKFFNPANDSYALYTGIDAGLRFYVTVGNNIVVSSPDAGRVVWDGEFHHVVGTYDRNFVRLYVDGVETNSGTPATAPIRYSSDPVNELFLGVSSGQLDLGLRSTIDEVRIYNRALTAPEIRRLSVESHVADDFRNTLVTGLSPLATNGPFFNSTITNLIISLGQPLETDFFNLTNIVVDGPMGRVQAIGIVEICERTYQITFPPLSADGAYQFTLLPTLLGTNGLPLDLNLNGTPGEANDFVSFTLFVDRTGSRVTQHSPSGGVPLGLGTIEIEFNEAMDPATFNPSDASILTPAGQTNAITAVQTISSNRFRITFPPLGTPGLHRLRVGPNVQDLAGNSLDHDRDGIAGEAADDVYDACFYVHAIPTPGLVHWWEGDGNALDAASGSHGTLQNGTAFAAGTNGSAFAFDGNDDYVLLPDTTKNLAEGTVELWFKVNSWNWSAAPDGLYFWSGTVSLPGSAIPGDGISLGNDRQFTGSGQLMFGIYEGPWHWAFSGVTPQPGLWYHVAGTWGPAGIQIYVNGALRGTNSFTGPAPPWTMYNLIGRSSWPSSGVNASIDDVRVYPRARTPSEIQSDFAFTTVLDASQTHLTGVSPLGRNGGYFYTPIANLIFSYSRPIAADAFNATNIIVDGQMGLRHALAISEICERTYEIAFAPLTEDGPYHFTLLPTLRGADGLPLDINLNGTPGEPDDTFTFTLILDTRAPRVTQHTPQGDISGTVTNVDVWFSEAMAKASLVPANARLTNTTGQAVSISAIQEVGLNRFRFSFAQQTATGLYRLGLSSNVTDLAGNSLTPALSPGGGEGVISFNLVEVDLRLGNVTTSTNQLVVGETLTVSWMGANGTNGSGAQLLGSWIDAVYISPFPYWSNFNAVRLATVLHTNGLAQNQFYTASATVAVPGLLPGPYYLLVRADIANAERETGEANNLVAFGPLPLTVPALNSGTPFSGTLTPDNRARYFAITLAPGDSLRLRLSGQGGGVNHLFASLGAIPTALASDFRAVASGPGQEVVLTGPPGGGTFYILVQGDQISGANPFTLLADTAPLFLTGLSPARHGNATAALVTLRGAGFDETTGVEFLATNGAVQLPGQIEFLSAETLRLHLPLTNWPAGLYTVRATKGAASNTLANAFEVVAGGITRLETHLVVPSAVGFNIPIRQTIWIEYRNTGEIPMPAPLLVLRGSHGARITADPALAVPRGGFGAIPGVSDTVQVLGLGPGATPWILQPGESGRIPVYYLGLSAYSGYPQVTFTLNAVTGDDARAINWAEQGQLLRVPGLSDRRWAFFAQEFQSRVGTSWGNYVQLLAQTANDLSAVSQPTFTAQSLWDGILNSILPDWLAKLLTDIHPQHLCPFPPAPEDGCPQQNQDKYNDMLNKWKQADQAFKLAEFKQDVYQANAEAVLWEVTKDLTRFAKDLLVMYAGTKKGQKAFQFFQRLETYDNLLEATLSAKSLADSLYSRIKSQAPSQSLQDDALELYNASLSMLSEATSAASVMQNGQNLPIEIATSAAEFLSLLDLYFDIRDLSFAIYNGVRQGHEDYNTLLAALEMYQDRLQQFKQALGHYAGLPPCNPPPMTPTVRPAAGGKGQANSDTEVFMSLVAEAPSGDLAQVTIGLQSVNGDQNTTWGPMVLLTGGGLIPMGPTMPNVWAVGGTVDNGTVVPGLTLSGLPRHDPGDPCTPDPTIWIFKVTALTFGGLTGGSSFDYTWQPQPATNCVCTSNCTNLPPPMPPIPPPCQPGSTNCTGGTAGTASSFDPNDKLAPAGYGAEGFVPPGESLFYQVRFENKSDATAPAREITITDTLDPNLDLETFEWFEIAFGPVTLSVPPGLNRYQTLLPLTFTNPITGMPCDGCLWAEVDAALDFATRRLTVTLSAFDPLTGWFPEDPFLGLLYPNDAMRRGEGSISYFVSPSAGLATGTAITNRARIVFDYNDPIDTPLVLNTIDAGAPSSSVTPLSAHSTTTFLLQWGGSDDAAGSGIGSIDIYVAATTNGAIEVPPLGYALWLHGTTSTSAMFHGAAGYTYSFYSVAQDNVGNEEAIPAVADSQTTTTGNSPPVLNPIADRTAEVGRFVTLTNFARDFDVPPQTITFSLGPGAPAEASIDSVNGRFRWTPQCAQGSSTNVITVLATDSGLPPLTATQTFRITVPECVETALGGAVMRAGDRACVPVDLISTVDLTNLTFAVDYPSNRFTSFTVFALAPAGSTGVVESMTATQAMIRLTPPAMQFLRGPLRVAELCFNASTGLHSAFVPLQTAEVVGREAGGTVVANASGRPSRIVVIEQEPLVEATQSTNGIRKLVLYGKPGASYLLEWRTNLFDGSAWQPGWRVPLTNLFQVLEGIDAKPAQLYYRAQEFFADPPILEAGRASDGTLTLMLYGRPGTNYVIQSTTNLAGGGSWVSGMSFTLTNSFRALEGIPPTNWAEIFRATRP